MNPKVKALSPFKLIEGGVKKAGSSIGRALRKGVETVMAPSVRVGKIQDAKMEEMSRKAKRGELNY